MLQFRYCVLDVPEQADARMSIVRSLLPSRTKSSTRTSVAQRASNQRMKDGSEICPGGSVHYCMR